MIGTPEGPAFDIHRVHPGADGCRQGLLLRAAPSQRQLVRGLVRHIRPRQRVERCITSRLDDTGFTRLFQSRFASRAIPAAQPLRQRPQRVTDLTMNARQVHAGTSIRDGKAG